MPDPEDLLVVLIDEPDVEPIVVLADPPSLGEIAVVAVEGAPDAGRGAVFLDELRDVEASPSTPGLLERQSDRVVRPVSREALLEPHVTASEPHPAYDDMGSLVLLFENGLV